jgi:adenosylcobinamide-phosphate synthase
VDVWLAGLLDLFGEPPNRVHPVAGFGALAALLERRFYRDSAWVGGVLALALVLLAAGLGWGLERALAGRPPGVRLPALALLLKPSFALAALLGEVRAVAAALEAGLEDGRARVGRIVSRRTDDLDAAGVRMAALESLAENLVDSLVAPLFYYLVLGLPGAYLYRAANTLDAIWGYPSARYARFGRVAARLDDLLNLLPARLGALLLGGAGVGLGRLVREAGKTPSPNAGWPMAAFALRHGLRLEKPGVYVLNRDGRAPGFGDLRRAIGRVAVLGYAWILAAWAIAWGVGR